MKLVVLKSLHHVTFNLQIASYATIFNRQNTFLGKCNAIWMSFFKI